MSIAEDICIGAICQYCLAELKDPSGMPGTCTDCWEPEEADNQLLDYKGEEKLHE